MSHLISLVLLVSPSKHHPFPWDTGSQSSIYRFSLSEFRNQWGTETSGASASTYPEDGSHSSTILFRSCGNILVGYLHRSVSHTT